MRMKMEQKYKKLVGSSIAGMVYMCKHLVLEPWKQIIKHLKTLALDVPVSGCNLDPVHKQDVMKATAMLKRKEEYAAIFAFDVKVMTQC